MRNRNHSLRRFVMRGIFNASLILSLFVCFVAANGQATGDPPKPMVRKYIFTYVSVMDPDVVEDVFGKRISDRFVVIQVTISNKNSNFQFLIHDVSLDLRRVFGKRISYNLDAEQLEQCACIRECVARSHPGTAESEPATSARVSKCKVECGRDCSPEGVPELMFQLSSLELSLIRGVAEKGVAQDRRNKVLRYLEGAGTIAAGLIGFAGFGPKYSDFMALYNGPGLSSYRHIYPDFTMNQMNRLSDSAYKSNTLIPKERSTVIVAFIPQAMFLRPEQRKLFRKDPTGLYPDLASGNTDNTIDFRKTEALVAGAFVTEVENLPLILTGVQIESDQLLEFLKPNPTVRGYILGQNLENANITLVNPPAGVQIAPDKDATPEEGKLFFVITANGPVPEGTPLNFKVFNKQNSQNISQSVSFTTPAPEVNPLPAPLEGTEGGADVAVSITGKNLIAGLTKLGIAESGTGVTASFSVEDSEDDSGPVTATLKMTNAKPGSYNLVIRNGNKTVTVPFEVKAKPTP